jgi:signal transduction histidine kinase
VNEGFIEKYVSAIKARVLIWLLILGLICIGALFVAVEVLELPSVVVFPVAAVFWGIVCIFASSHIGGAATKPMRYLSQAILHISPKETLIAAPNIDELSLGRELVASLTRQVYDLATNGAPTQTARTATNQQSSLDLITLPIFGLDSAGKIIISNTTAAAVFKDNSGLAGSSLHQIMTLEFEADDTLDAWLEATKNQAVNANKTWNKVKVTKAGTSESTYFDIAASLSQQNASGIELMIVFFDHSDAYATEQDAMSFVALAVHELRTPLTILRGYIEAIEDELGPNINDETKTFIYKMNISAETLAGFVSKILSVARVEENQLNLHLSEDDWVLTLKTVLSSLQMRAKVNDKVISLEVGENIPPVAVDKITISEVLTNLVDNAIKYSPEGAQSIIVKSYVNQEGLVETTVQDQGVGIPSSVMPHLFTKFYRNHRNANQIGGTGLGLYLSKAIITAHHGHIWAQSSDGKGSTFSFTILPYDRLAEADKTDNNEITRQRHGWIKNHTMQRQ